MSGRAEETSHSHVLAVVAMQTRDGVMIPLGACVKRGNSSVPMQPSLTNLQPKSNGYRSGLIRITCASTTAWFPDWRMEHVGISLPRRARFVVVYRNGDFTW
jgi:hypothetical protein